MDRVTRYPIFGNPHSPRVAGVAFDGDTSYTFEVVGVGSVARGWGRDEPPAWPAGHEASLEVVRTGTSRSPCAFPGRLAPWPPCPEDEEDEEVKTYYLEARDTPPWQPQDLERERQAVIQGQAVRKSGTVATLRGAPDHGEPRSPGRPQSMPLEENVIDREQIDFLAARRQFLSLEQTQPPPRAAHPGAGAPRNQPGASQASKALNGLPLANGHAIPVKPQAKEAVAEEERVHGLPTRSGAQALDRPGSQSQEGSPEPPKETPIEREIRLAQEREADLREQRGLRRAASHQELVEIPARPLLSTVSLSAAPRRDRGRPSLYVQRDIAQESQREQDHRREGLQVGRASTPDWSSEGPQPLLRRVHSSDSILSPTPDASVASPAPEARKVNRLPPDAYQAYLRPQTPPGASPAFPTYGKPRGLSADQARPVGSAKAAGSQKHASESSGKPSGTKREASRGPLRTSGGVVRWEYFRLRPLRFGVPDEPEEAEAPRVWGWEVAGAPALRLQKSRSSELLEREVERVLRREREVAEERRSALYPAVFSPPPDECCGRDSRSSSRASGIAGSDSVSESHYFIPIHTHSGLVWAAEAPPEDAPGQRKKNGQWYAGINPSDHVNSEVLEATRVTRHKNAMAQRWEARIYASEDED
ncbi:mitotic interactor and substrate of PLK1 [Hippopotamus amphibius kiboko]|uniref:mitotic interactor and substrate of PLK1 n=1 Tax=Hippopotamus amphibius kiboko TaxID=575201 RepID=UPI00259A24F0|nr:mitotic interactor and substrate of PLK1 [Hippopotamus amphibius kiboko]